MPNTTTYDFGDVIVIDIIYTNQIDSELRPSVVISTLEYNQSQPDIIVMPITSKNYPTVIPISNWKTAGLIKESFIKPVIGTYQKGDVIRQLGKIDPNTRVALKKKIAQMLGFKQTTPSSIAPVPPS